MSQHYTEYTEEYQPTKNTRLKAAIFNRFIESIEKDKVPHKQTHNHWVIVNEKLRVHPVNMIIQFIGRTKKYEFKSREKLYQMVLDNSFNEDNSTKTVTENKVVIEVVLENKNDLLRNITKPSPDSDKVYYDYNQIMEKLIDGVIKGNEEGNIPMACTVSCGVYGNNYETEASYVFILDSFKGFDRHQKYTYNYNCIAS